MISEPNKYWKAERKWPREGRWDGLDLVFIFRAFNMIGEFLFKAEWSGTEGYAEPVPLFPQNQSEATFEQLNLAEMALQSDYAGYNGRRPLPPPSPTRVGGLGGLGGINTSAPLLLPELHPRFFDDDWNEAVRIWGGWAALRDRAIERRRTVVEWLTARIADDKKLRVILRHIQSGIQIVGPAEHWNGHWHQLEARWRRGSYYLQAPFAQPGISEIGWEEVAVFVVQEDLKALLDAAQDGGEIASVGKPLNVLGRNDNGGTKISEVGAAKPGSGARIGKPKKDDQRWLYKMHLLVETGIPEYPAAARIVDEHGSKMDGASDDAKRDRLRTKYRGLRRAGQLASLALGE